MANTYSGRSFSTFWGNAIDPTKSKSELILRRVAQGQLRAHSIRATSFESLSISSTEAHSHRAEPTQDFDHFIVTLEQKPWALRPYLRLGQYSEQTYLLQ